MTIFFNDGKSKYILIHTDNDQDWQELINCCDGYLSKSAYRQLYDYLEIDTKTIILEKSYFDRDYRDTYHNFFSRKFANYPSTAYRVNFFSERVSPDSLYSLDSFQDSYIGFTVIRPNRINPIGRTILNPDKLSKIRGYTCLSEHVVHILGAELKIKGFPYMSQDTDVTVCAHAACWMVFRYFSQRYSRYAEVWPFEVTQLTKNVSKGRLVPSKGLTAEQVTEMFSRFGFYPEIYIRETMDDQAFYRCLYKYIESGLPVVAGLTNHSHAITLFGHISNFTKKDIETPGSSDQYLDAYIINDDNYMPYQAMGESGFAASEHLSKYVINDIDVFIVPLYEKIHLSAEHVMEIKDGLLTDHDIGINSQAKFLKYENLITRTFLTSSKSYKKTRRQDDLPEGLSKIYCEMEMPKFIWVCELSTPEAFQNGEVYGEIIFDATANKYDVFSFLSIHYPGGFLLLNDRNYLTEDPNRFTLCQISERQKNEPEPYCCYINNLKEAIS